MEISPFIRSVLHVSCLSKEINCSKLGELSAKMRQRALSGIAIEIFDDIVNRIENDIVTWGNLFLSGNTIYCDIQFCLCQSKFTALNGNENRSSC